MKYFKLKPKKPPSTRWVFTNEQRKSLWWMKFISTVVAGWKYRYAWYDLCAKIFCSSLVHDEDVRPWWRDSHCSEHTYHSKRSASVWLFNSFHEMAAHKSQNCSEKEMFYYACFNCVYQRYVCLYISSFSAKKQNNTRLSLHFIHVDMNFFSSLLSTQHFSSSSLVSA